METIDLFVTPVYAIVSPERGDVLCIFKYRGVAEIAAQILRNRRSWLGKLFNTPRYIVVDTKLMMKFGDDICARARCLNAKR